MCNALHKGPRDDKYAVGSQATSPLMIGFGAIALALGNLWVWSIGAEIASAVVANDMVQVESERQIEGGTAGRPSLATWHPVSRKVAVVSQVFPSNFRNFRTAAAKTR